MHRSSSCPVPCLHVILVIITGLSPQTVTQQISQANAHMFMWAIRVPDQANTEQAHVLFSMNPSFKKSVGGRVVFQSDGACSGVEQVKDLRCLSLLLYRLVCLCEGLHRGGTGRLLVGAQPLWCLDISVTAAAAGSLCCCLQDIISKLD